jgi:hypothetical protein
MDRAQSAEQHTADAGEDRSATGRNAVPTEEGKESGEEGVNLHGGHHGVGEQSSKFGGEAAAGGLDDTRSFRPWRTAGHSEGNT